MRSVIYSLVFIICSCGAGSICAQVIQGSIIDVETQAPVPYVDILFVDLQSGTSTNEAGVFIIVHVSLPKLHIQLSAIGYELLDTTIILDSRMQFNFYLRPTHLELEEVVIKSTGGKLSTNQVVEVAHLKLSDIQESAATNLTETITNIPGVDNLSTGAGIGKPVIRGLFGNRIVTYAQGIRVENQQWGGEHGLGVGGLGLESVEVIKGPASLLFGSDAIGGVLYFNDAKYAKENSRSFFVSSKFLSNTLGTDNNIGFKMNYKGFKWNIFGNYANHTDYQVPEDNRVLNTRFNTSNFKTDLGFGSKHWIGNLRYAYMHNNFGIVEDAVYTETKDKKMEAPFQSINNHNLSFENTFLFRASRLDVTLGFSANSRKEFEEEEPDMAALDLRLQNYSYQVKWSSPIYGTYFQTILGSQGMMQQNKNAGEELLIPDARSTDVGLFALENISMKNLEIVLGLRADFRTIDAHRTTSEELTIPALKRNFSGVSFSAGAVYDLGKFKLRGNFANAFRSPTTGELLSNGPHHGSSQFIIGDRDLETERSQQIDFSIDYLDEHFNFTFQPFYNHISNYIYLSSMDTIIDEFPAFRYVQQNAKLYGGEAGVHWHPHQLHGLHIEANYALVIGQQAKDEYLNLMPQARISTKLKYEWEKENKLGLKNMYLDYLYKFKQTRLATDELPSAAYGLVSLGMRFEKEVRQHALTLDFGVKNLFNTRYVDHLARLKYLGIPAAGINFYVDVKYALHSK